MEGLLFLIMVFVLGYAADSGIIMSSCLILILLHWFGLFSVIGFLHDRGLEIGLIFLLMSLLSSLFIGNIDWSKFKSYILSRRGVIAIIAGLLATRVNYMGLRLLGASPQLVAGIVIGSLIGITLFGGIPVGPLMAAAIAAIMMKIYNFFL